MLGFKKSDTDISPQKQYSFVNIKTHRTPPLPTTTHHPQPYRVPNPIPFIYRLIQLPTPHTPLPSHPATICYGPLPPVFNCQYLISIGVLREECSSLAGQLAALSRQKDAGERDAADALAEQAKNLAEVMDEVACLKAAKEEGQGRIVALELQVGWRFVVF